MNLSRKYIKVYLKQQKSAGVKNGNFVIAFKIRKNSVSATVKNSTMMMQSSS